MSGGVCKSAVNASLFGRGTGAKTAGAKAAGTRSMHGKVLAASKCSVARLQDSKSEDSKADARRWREPVPEPSAPCLKLAQPWAGLVQRVLKRCGGLT